MELHFMVLAILLLTLIASNAIRRAEEEMIERHELERQARKEPTSTAVDTEPTSGTQVRA